MNTLYAHFSTKGRETIVLSCKIVPLNAAVVGSEWNFDDLQVDCILLEVKHKLSFAIFYLYTILRYEIWYFDQEHIFMGKWLNDPTEELTNYIKTEASYIALIPLSNEEVKKTDWITDFQCHSFEIYPTAESKLQPFMPGYGLFPYIIIKNGFDKYMQIPIHINQYIDRINFPGTYLTGIEEEVQTDTEKFTNLLLVRTQKVKEIIEKNQKLEIQVCLVLSATECYNFDKKTVLKSDTIPKGGTLVSQHMEIIVICRKHYLENQ
jgi:hypothetical protein